MKDWGHPETRGSRRMEIMVPMRLRYSSTRIVVYSNTSCKHIQETSYSLSICQGYGMEKCPKNVYYRQIHLNIKCKLLFELSILWG